MRGILAFLLLAGCDPMAPSWDVAQPVAKPAPPAPAPAPSVQAPAPAEEPKTGFDFDAEDRPTQEAVEKPAPGEDDALALQARLLGVPLAERPGTAVPLVPDVAQAAGGFGIRVISIVTDVQPPMAILGLPNGTEIVVKPGTMLPEAHLVVLAIGRSAVQLAEIVPEGFATRVVTTTVPALYPVTGAASPASP